MIIVTLGVHGIAVDKYFQNKRSHFGVITANGVNTYSGPYYGENTVLFRINEGIRVEIQQTQENWIEIILIDGKKGWVPTESMRRLRWNYLFSISCSYKFLLAKTLYSGSIWIQ